MSIIDPSLTPYTRPTIHIAGINGKGNVSSALLTSILGTLRIGRIHDCISINNKPVSLASYITTRHQVEDTDTTHGTCLSSFELLSTLTALRIFEDAAVDIVVLEVGMSMGGLLDAN